MKYLNPYKNKDELTEKIDSAIEDYKDFLTEGKIGDWLIRAPKIRRLQEKANQLRLRAVRAEAEQRKQIDRVIAAGGRVDAGRMWELLQHKLDAWEDTAREYEMEADDIAKGSDTLRRVRRAAKLKGTFKINSEKIAEAESEERRELMKHNNEILRIIRQEERIIADKTEADRLRLQIQKEKELAKTAGAKAVDSKSMYFDNKKAEDYRKVRIEKEKAKKEGEPYELPFSYNDNVEN